MRIDWKNSLLVVTALSLSGVAYLLYNSSLRQDYIEVQLGETFEIKLHENGSTGHSNCWINQYNSKHIVLMQQEYRRSWSERLGAVGAGGAMVWTFKGIKPGADTVKISFCPTAIMRKDCKYFNSDTILPDRVVYVKVFDVN
jgi:predicted secreted protein